MSRRNSVQQNGRKGFRGQNGGKKFVPRDQQLKNNNFNRNGRF